MLSNIFSSMFIVQLVQVYVGHLVSFGISVQWKCVSIFVHKIFLKLESGNRRTQSIYLGEYNTYGWSFIASQRIWFIDVLYSTKSSSEKASLAVFLTTSVQMNKKETKQRYSLAVAKFK